MTRPPSSTAGNALFLILIAVALFAALSYAITQSSRGGGNIDKEQAKLNTAVDELCTAHVQQAVLRLETVGGCAEAQISYELSDGTNANPAAPEDKHCHVFDAAGAGETACGSYLLPRSSCGEDSAAPGDVISGGDCDGLVYVSNNLGSRLYTTAADYGHWCWAEAQDQCSGLGDGWHLPSKSELNELFLARHAGALNGSFEECCSGLNWYSSATEYDGGNAWVQNFNDGEQTGGDKNQCAYYVRCVR